MDCTPELEETAEWVRRVKLPQARADFCHFIWVALNGCLTVQLMLLWLRIHTIRKEDERIATECIAMG